MTMILTRKEHLKRTVAQLLEKQLDEKDKLELENQKLKENLDNALSNLGNGGFGDGEGISKLWVEKTALLEAQEAINNSIILKDQSVSDEFQEARKELINGLRGMSSSLIIGVKKMAELDLKPFLVAPNKLDCSAEEALSSAIQLCGSWRKKIKDPNWHPFKVIKVGDTNKEVLDEEDEKLKCLKQESDEEVYKAVITAIIEMNQYNPTGDINEPIKEIWNFKEGKRATLKEGISFLLKMYMRKV
ncbi:hypothetical protein MKX01_006486 [Papaver californicum]|nr:hypothetical protein MKX01_006486 [Papaver californicum]